MKKLLVLLLSLLLTGLTACAQDGVDDVQSSFPKSSTQGSSVESPSESVSSEASMTTTVIGPFLTTTVFSLGAFAPSYPQNAVYIPIKYGRVEKEPLMDWGSKVEKDSSETEDKYERGLAIIVLNTASEAFRGLVDLASYFKLLSYQEGYTEEGVFYAKKIPSEIYLADETKKYVIKQDGTKYFTGEEVQLALPESLFTGSEGEIVIYVGEYALEKDCDDWGSWDVDEEYIQYTVQNGEVRLS